MSGFKIPRLESIASRAVSRAKGEMSRQSILLRKTQPAVERCRYCGFAHNLTSYCYRVPFSARMGRGRSRKSPTTSSSSSSSSEDEERSNASDDGGSVGTQSDSEEEEQAAGDGGVDPLEDFFSAQKRVDTKETKLTLRPSSLKYYFSTVLKNGELTKEGREELQEKYYLDPTQYEKLRPPRLDDTKLFKLGDKEFIASRAGRLISLHDKYVETYYHHSCLIFS